jgi:hypothetical protein
LKNGNFLTCRIVTPKSANQLPSKGITLREFCRNFRCKMNSLMRSYESIKQTESNVTTSLVLRGYLNRHPSVFPPVRLVIHPFIYLSVYPSISTSTHASIHLFTLPPYLSIYLSTHLSLCLSESPSACTSVSLRLLSSYLSLSI